MAGFLFHISTIALYLQHNCNYNDFNFEMTIFAF